MPLLKIQTNVSIAPEAQPPLLAKLSKTVASQLSKSERYVMVALESAAPMLFAGSDAPLAYVELKSIGLPDAQTPALSAAICGALSAELDIPAERIYIEFAAPQGRHWGWNGATF